MKKISAPHWQNVAIVRVVGFNLWTKKQVDFFTQQLKAKLKCDVLVVDAEMVDITFVETS